MQDPSRRVFLARHAQTEWNREGRRQGQLDSALTAVGVAQARRHAAVLRPASVTLAQPREPSVARFATRSIAPPTPAPAPEVQVAESTPAPLPPPRAAVAKAVGKPPLPASKPLPTSLTA